MNFIQGGGDFFPFDLSYRAGSFFAAENGEVGYGLGITEFAGQDKFGPAKIGLEIIQRPDAVGIEAQIGLDVVKDESAERLIGGLDGQGKFALPQDDAVDLQLAVKQRPI